MSINNYCPECGNKINESVIYCPNCGKKIHNAESKRDRIIGKTSRRGNNLYIAGIIVLFVIFLIYYFNSEPSKAYSIIKEQPRVTDNVDYPQSRFDHIITVAFEKEGKIIIPLELVKENKFARFQVAGLPESTPPILAYLTEDGKVVTAISMCEPCNSTEFHIQGGDLVCNSCGTTWDLNNLDAISGSCGKYPPDPIPSKIVGNEIQIEKQFVTNWRRRV
jgi:uncharacterized membrane protein